MQGSGGRAAVAARTGEATQETVSSGAAARAGEAACVSVWVGVSGSVFRSGRAQGRWRAQQGKGVPTVTAAAGAASRKGGRAGAAANLGRRHERDRQWQQDGSVRGSGGARGIGECGGSVSVQGRQQRKRGKWCQRAKSRAAEASSASAGGSAGTAAAERQRLRGCQRGRQQRLCGSGGTKASAGAAVAGGSVQERQWRCKRPRGRQKGRRTRVWQRQREIERKGRTAAGVPNSESAKKGRGAARRNGNNTN